MARTLRFLLAVDSQLDRAERKLASFRREVKGPLDAHIHDKTGKMGATNVRQH